VGIGPALETLTVRCAACGETSIVTVPDEGDAQPVICPNCDGTDAEPQSNTHVGDDGPPLRFFSCRSCRFFWSLPRPKRRPRG